MTEIGIVIIGRNEGERLLRCFTSILQHTNFKAVVYVDSGSTDQSVNIAESFGTDVVLLDMSTPFSAGRARNEGFKHVIHKHPKLQYIQFIDGDCELCDKWFASASQHMKEHASCAIVAGRLKERFPDRSIYNLLCDFEWNTPAGEVNSCGGIFMIRKSCFLEVGGFNPEVVSGEEPELCYRLRENGWTIFRLAQLMALHDSAMTRFPQWWKRSIRSGQGFAQGYALHSSGSNYKLLDLLRIWVWSFVFPCLIFFSAMWGSPWCLFLFIIYPIQILRIAKNINNILDDWNHSFYYAFFNVLAKWPQLFGQVIFLTKKISKKHLTIIEYKQ